MDYPRGVRFSYQGTRYLVEFHCISKNPAQKCSNPDCTDKAVFAVTIVINKISIKESSQEIVLDPRHKMWATIATIVRLREGDNQTHCLEANSFRTCEKAMAYQNYAATRDAFGVRVSEREGWNKLYLSRQRHLARKERKRLKKERKAMKRAQRCQQLSGRR
ncbi:MAG TPA: hypothetical protein VMU07_03295 [Candidatus Paceibacterota bacterium]|nr:hypothetical protein [Candidatus Paceibacterota bacterium]